MNKFWSCSLMFWLWGAGACAAADPADDGELWAERESIVGGRSDRGKDPAVVAIDIGGQGLCTGSLIAPNWVLTARHCVSQTDSAVECPAHRAQIRGEYPADTFTILAGNDVNSARPLALGRRVVVPPGQLLCDSDLALIELDRSVTNIAPLALGSLAGVTTVRGVGFGKRGDRAAAGKKMTRGNVPILARSRAEFEVGVVSCSGDSGGPALDTQGRVVGVVSRGGPTCSGSESRNIYTRIDAFRAFLSQVPRLRVPQ